MNPDVRRLADAEFRATFAQPVRRVGPDEAPPLDLWPYFDAIPADDFAGYTCSEGRVAHAWRMGDARREHVLVACDDPDVFMVLVLDLDAGRVAGHHLLDLPDLYGLRE